MKKKVNLPEITTQVKNIDDNFFTFHKEIIYKILENTVPPDFFETTDFQAKLPIFKSHICKDLPGHVYFYCFNKFDKYTLKLLTELLSHWLIPGRSLNFSRIFSAEFCIPSVGSSVFMVSELVIQVTSQSDLDQIIHHLPFVKKELALGMQTPHFARHLLEIKALTIDSKVSLIHENMIYLVEKKPHYFDPSLLKEAQYFLIVCEDEFKLQRSCRHICRIICTQYFFKKSLIAKLRVSNKRHLFLKLQRAQINVQNVKKNVLILIVGFNLLSEKEVFEKHHVMRAIHDQIPTALMIENSFFNEHRSNDSFCTIYLEIEKDTGERFSGQEIAKLRKDLPVSLLEGIEQMVHSVFMPRNEEEVMRNILSLSCEVKYIHDLPQVMILFDDQTASKLAFTVIIVRIVKPEDDTLENLFDKSNTFLEYSHDRCKTVGYLRGKYTKEASVFGLKIKKDNFIRRDYSINLNKARQAIMLELLSIIGEFRDYNGGMISKQNELLLEVKELVFNGNNFNDLLFENFFFSIMPTVMCTVLEPEILKSFYGLLCQTIEIEIDPNKNYCLNELIESNYVFLMIKTELRLKRNEMLQALAVLNPKSSDIATSYVKIQDVHYNGYAFKCSDPVRQREFINIVNATSARIFQNSEAIQNNSLV